MSSQPKYNKGDWVIITKRNTGGVVSDVFKMPDYGWGYEVEVLVDGKGSFYWEDDLHMKNNGNNNNNNNVGGYILKKGVWSSAGWWDTDDEDEGGNKDAEPPKWKPKSLCECGISAAYGEGAKAWMHSTWCILYKKGSHE